MADDQLFFQLAAGLIPALIFGGLLTDRLRPPKDASPGVITILAVLLTWGAAFALYAEVTAISNAIAGGSADTKDRIVVSAAVIGSTVLILILIVAPWLQRVPQRTRQAQVVFMVVSLIPLLLLGCSSVQLLDSSIQLAATQEEFGEIDEDGNPVPRDRAATRHEAQAITERYFDLTREEIRLRASRAALKGADARSTARRRPLTRQLESIAYEQKVLVGRASELPGTEFLHDITLGAGQP